MIGESPLGAAPLGSGSDSGALEASVMVAVNASGLLFSLYGAIAATRPAWALTAHGSGYAALAWPIRALTAHGESRSGSASLIWPARDLTAHGGGSASLTWPSRMMVVAGTLESAGSIAVEWPVRTLTAVGMATDVGAASLIWPARTLVAYGGGSATLVWPPRQLTVSGALEGIGTVRLPWPARTLTVTGRVGGVGTARLRWPVRALAASGWLGGVGTIALTWPMRGLAAQGLGVSTETTYAINLSTGAGTQLLLGPFDQLVTAHGRLYGLRNGALVYFGGDRDQGAAIPATMRFAPQQFGTLQAKRLDGHVYLNLRENDGVTLTVVQDETTSWDYQTPADNAPGIGTHRVKVGRGITFHSIGLTMKNRNGGRLDVGGLEIPVHPLSRKPR